MPEVKRKPKHSDGLGQHGRGMCHCWIVGHFEETGRHKAVCGLESSTGPKWGSRHGPWCRVCVVCADLEREVLHP